MVDRFPARLGRPNHLDAEDRGNDHGAARAARTDLGGAPSVGGGKQAVCWLDEDRIGRSIADDLQDHFLVLGAVPMDGPCRVHHVAAGLEPFS
jgi:hypothetical protein